jgi:hypothetical protein
MSSASVIGVSMSEPTDVETLLPSRETQPGNLHSNNCAAFHRISLPSGDLFGRDGCMKE